ncbi:MAG TPA: phosphoglucosamine mutase [Thermoanaerobaculia bacterium]|nr:phosphoglucosamine mutase [Thermoanaerobaculia bacterium]
MRTLFGTDGIRGKAREFPLDTQTMFALGQALATRFISASSRADILLGMDTRESGPEIANALAAGIRQAGGDATFIGVVPTPAVAYLCRTSDASAGISISASHNPFEDNGVKVFGHDGMKLADSLEKAIEDDLLRIRNEENSIEDQALMESPALISAYKAFLVGNFPAAALRGLRVVLDTGHGAAYRIGPEVFRELGAEVIVLHDQPSGVNINEGSGALHPEKMSDRVVKEKADFGVAFDGDADRAIFVDDSGKVRDGDEILFLWAKSLKERNELPKATVVSTVMSNFGFEKQLQADGIRLMRAGVGDKYVLEMMLANQAALGGEQSGHIIDFAVHTTGDGIHSGLRIAELLASSKAKFSSLRTFEPYPQILKNEKVASKPPLETLPDYRAAAAEAERQLGGRGRILVRYSGTENLVRVMVEGDDAGEIEQIASRLVEVLRSEIGRG